MKKAKKSCVICQGKGYAEVQPDFLHEYGLTHLEKCDYCRVFDCDYDAALHAKSDGVQLIICEKLSLNPMFNNEETVKILKSLHMKYKKF